MKSERGEWKSWLKTQHSKKEDMASSPITSWQIDGETVETCQTWFSWAPKSLQMVTAAMKLKDTCSWKKDYDKSRQHIKNQQHHFANKGLYSQSYGFSSSHVWMWEVDHKEGWAWKNWGFRIVVLEKTLETARKPNQSTLKEINLDYSLERLMLKLKLQYFGHLIQSQLIGKDPHARKHWG